MKPVPTGAAFREWVQRPDGTLYRLLRYKDKAKADKAVAILRSRGFEAYVLERMNSAGKVYYHVKITVLVPPSYEMWSAMLSVINK